MQFSAEQEKEFESIATSLKWRKKVQFIALAIFLVVSQGVIWLLELPESMTREGGYILAGILFTMFWPLSIAVKNETALFKLVLAMKSQTKMYNTP